MKIFIIGGFIVAAVAFFAYRRQITGSAIPFADSETPFYALSVGALNGGVINMSDYKGKYVLCVNVASRCGYTYQYKALQELYSIYSDKLIVLGFPCNQFLGQEPGNAKDIEEFCSNNYGVTFPLSEKIRVKGRDQHPVYQWLTKKTLNGVSDAEIKWNFYKILISPEGKWIGAFPSSVDPLSTEITSQLK
ncbi:MAG: glutathione peroxidase [Crocinitomicaceae bacterium]|nr:glutathione peroxidase [Crocinitomicaceae bacterium]